MVLWILSSAFSREWHTTYIVENRFPRADHKSEYMETFKAWMIMDVYEISKGILSEDSIKVVLILDLKDYKLHQIYRWIHK